MADDKHSFVIADYVIFGITIVISLGIGVFYAFSGGRQRTTSEYLVGGRSMSFIPVAISLMVSFESSIMMLGLPAEGYVYGVQWFWACFGNMLSHLLAIRIVVPLLHPLRLTSAYEYLEYRFNSKGVRLVGTFLGILTYTWYMGIVLFGPAVALEAVTNFPLYGAICTISIVSVLYTTIGGIKAVIWTDVFQAFVMFLGVFAVLIKGTIDVGGPSEVWHTANEGGRLNFWNFDPNPTIRHTFWNLFLGSLIRGFGLAFNQSTVQRISSTKSLQEARKVLMITAPAHFFALSLALYEGIVAYAFYQKKRCDPLKSGAIGNSNQLVPYVVSDMFADLPGMPGLFLASLFSASLSTLSSGLSSLSALLWADIVQPLVGEISESKATLIAKFSVILFGILACGVAVLVSMIGGTLIQIAGSLLSAFAGPLTGIFFLGCFFPSANAKGTIFGSVLALAFCTWISMGQNFSPNMIKTPWLPPAPTDQCPANLNVTDSWNSTFYENNTSIFTVTMEMTTEATQKLGPQGIEKLYTLSYQWLAPLGIFMTIFLGMIISLLTGSNKPGEVDPRYILNIADTLLICVPMSWRRKISSRGAQFNKEEYKAKFFDPAKKENVLNIEKDILVMESLADGQEDGADDKLAVITETAQQHQTLTVGNGDAVPADISNSTAAEESQEANAQKNEGEAANHM